MTWPSGLGFRLIERLSGSRWSLLGINPLIMGINGLISHSSTAV